MLVAMSSWVGTFVVWPIRLLNILLKTYSRAIPGQMDFLLLLVACHTNFLCSTCLFAEQLLLQNLVQCKLQNLVQCKTEELELLCWRMLLSWMCSNVFSRIMSALRHHFYLAKCCVLIWWEHKMVLLVLFCFLFLACWKLLVGTLCLGVGLLKHLFSNS